VCILFIGSNGMLGIIDFFRLLTPPDTPLFPSLDDEPQPVNTAPRGRPRSQPISISRSSTVSFQITLMNTIRFLIVSKSFLERKISLCFICLRKTYFFCSFADGKELQK
jgi:hypothetical protein